MQQMVLSIGGTQDGHFFRIVPSYVDKSKPAGRSQLPKPLLKDWIWSALTLRHIWDSPNLVWSLMALAMYFLVPYDLSPSSAAAKGVLTLEFFKQRFPLWFFVVLGYDAFWHVTLYFLNWAQRPFIPNRKYRVEKVLHNVFYSFIGVVIWVGFENVFAFLWSTGRLAYLSDAEAFSSGGGGLLRFFLGTVLIPLWRDAHFYGAHRLIHFKPLFTHIHSLHHRNTDIEPFAGLCMHPVEHLYYYSCILPSIFFFASPFHLLWNGAHLLLAPGASHSGYEDHFQADAFHYMHHRFFECNYAGFSAGFLDVLFETFVPNFKEKEGSAIEAREDPKSTLRGAPSPVAVAYLALSALCIALWAAVANSFAAAAAATGGAGVVGVASHTALALSLLAGCGPLAAAYALTFFAEGGSTKSFFEPYAKRPLWENVAHFVAGVLCCALPIAATCYQALHPPAGTAASR